MGIKKSEVINGIKKLKKQLVSVRTNTDAISYNSFKRDHVLLRNSHRNFPGYYYHSPNQEPVCLVQKLQPLHHLHKFFGYCKTNSAAAAGYHGYFVFLICPFHNDFNDNIMVTIIWTTQKSHVTKVHNIFATSFNEGFSFRH
jgi:hypothetical protein